MSLDMREHAFATPLSPRLASILDIEKNRSRRRTRGVCFVAARAMSLDMREHAFATPLSPRLASILDIEKNRSRRARGGFSVAARAFSAAGYDGKEFGGGGGLEGGGPFLGTLEQLADLGEESEVGAGAFRWRNRHDENSAGFAVEGVKRDRFTAYAHTRDERFDRGGFPVRYRYPVFHACRHLVFPFHDGKECGILVMDATACDQEVQEFVDNVDFFR
jgi:hypothetical protein